MRQTLAERAAEIGHEGRVRRYQRGMYYPTCSCGWGSPNHMMEKPRAVVYLNDHFRAVLQSRTPEQGPA